ncbi:MAG: glycosyltransferase family 2 protein [Candidatus Limnocylindria bacterium]
MVIVAARNEADRLGATIRALKEAFPDGRVIVADDGSTDGTGDVALAAGAELVRRGRPHGKGGGMSAAAATVTVLAEGADPPAFLLCDGDLGGSARELGRLVAAIEAGECDLAVASFARRAGGGFGIALRFARWVIARRCGYRAGAAISGQRAMRAEVLRAVLPFAPGYGMETAMTIDAVRAGYALCEVELDLEHRATGRSARGFAHRARQLIDFARVWWSRR